MPPAPSVRHQQIVGSVYRELHAYVSRHQLGQVFVSPLDVLLSRSPLHVLQPDVIVVTSGRHEIIRDRIEGAPDLVVEVLLPATAMDDKTRKAVLYGNYGVRDYWIVDPDSQTVDVRRLSEEAYERLGLYGHSDIIVSSLRADLNVPVSRLFA